MVYASEIQEMVRQAQFRFMELREGCCAWLRRINMHFFYFFLAGNRLRIFINPLSLNLTGSAVDPVSLPLTFR